MQKLPKELVGRRIKPVGQDRFGVACEARYQGSGRNRKLVLLKVKMPSGQIVSLHGADEIEKTEAHK